MKLHDRQPFPPGHLARYAPIGNGGFAWATNRFRCGGCTSKGVAVPCGVVFETQAGASEARCANCRTAHKREWFRLRSARPPAKGARMIDRGEHLAWAKKRALQYLDAGDLNNGFASMCSDLGKHPDLGCPPLLGQVGLLYVRNKDARGLRGWIEGFN